MYRREFSGRDFPLEKKIEFLISPPFRFRQPEIRPHEHAESSGAPEEGCLALRIPCRRIHEVWFENLGDDVDDLIAGPGKTDA